MISAVDKEDTTPGGHLMGGSNDAGIVKLQKESTVVLTSSAYNRVDCMGRQC